MSSNKKVMLVNVTHPEESRVAILEDGILSAYEIETHNRGHIMGNIYNAVVENVLPSLEAAFLWLGRDLKGFLPLDEVNFRLLPKRGTAKTKGKIEQHLHSGQKLMVQVVREPLGDKPPTVSTYFSIPGRYLVLMPGVDTKGISRKITDPKQRDRLREILEDLNVPEGFGVVIRTAGEGKTKAELQRDLRYLLRLWESVQKGSRSTSFPGLVYQERDLVIRTIRDYLTPDIEEVWIDSPETYERALAFVKDVMPSRARILRLYTGERPLFNKFNLEQQIESIYKRRVSLPSGGEIVIDGTEALTAIDVNTARSARKGDAEETALQTNLEAVKEITRQIRLRDLGGLIVIDFIDLANPKNVKKVERAMREAMRGDRARYDITPISKLGLMEMARQRLKSEKMRATYTTCPTCEGYGLVKTVETAALAALRRLQTRVVRGDAAEVRLTLPAEVATWILNHKRDDLNQLERRYETRIAIEPREPMLRHESEMHVVPREPRAPQALPAPARGPAEAALPSQEEIPAEAAPGGKAGEAPSPPAPDVTAAPDEAPAGAAEAAAAAEAEPAARKRRRRRRRKRPSSESAAAEAASASGAAVPDGPAPQPVPLTEAPDAPREEAPGGAAPPADGGGDGEFQTEPATEDPAPPKPRRRRRRRARKKADPGADASGSPGDEPPPEPDPSKIRADELMPAATGLTDGTADPRGTASGRSRRRRRRA